MIAKTLAILLILHIGKLGAQEIKWQKIEVDEKEMLNLLDDKKARFMSTDGFSDSLYNETTGEILIRTGIKIPSKNVDPGFYTNCTVSYSPETKNLNLLEYSSWSGGSYSPGTLPENFKDSVSPAPRHTYDGIAFSKKENAYYLILGANGRMHGNKTKPIGEEAKKALSDDNNSLWRFDLNTKKWTMIPNNIRQFWPSIYKVSSYESHLHAWDKKNKLIFISSGGNEIAFFDTTTQKWEQVSATNKSFFSLNGARSVWDSKRDLWIFRIGNKLQSFNPETLSYHLITPPYSDDYYKDLEDDLKKKSNTLKGICYHEKKDAYVISGIKGDDTFLYDIQNDKWENIKAGDFKISLGYLNYDSKSNKIILNYHLNIFELTLP